MPRKGYVQTPEHRAKIAAALAGKEKTEEHKRHIGEGVERRHTRKRALNPEVAAIGYYGPLYLRIGNFRFGFALNDLPEDDGNDGNVAG